MGIFGVGKERRFFLRLFIAKKEVELEFSLLCWEELAENVETHFQYSN